MKKLLLIIIVFIIGYNLQAQNKSLSFEYGQVSLTRYDTTGAHEYWGGGNIHPFIKYKYYCIGRTYVPSKLSKSTWGWRYYVFGSEPSDILYHSSFVIEWQYLLTIKNRIQPYFALNLGYSSDGIIYNHLLSIGGVGGVQLFLTNKIALDFRYRIDFEKYLFHTNGFVIPRKAIKTNELVTFFGVGLKFYYKSIWKK